MFINIYINCEMTTRPPFARCPAFWTGCQNFGECWRNVYNYEVKNFDSACEDVWQQVKPLYQQIHAYVRRKLLNRYSNNTKDFPSTRQIPAHILGESSHLEVESNHLTVKLVFHSLLSSEVHHAAI